MEESEERQTSTGRFEDYAEDVLSYRQKMREVADVLEEYKDNVELFDRNVLDEEDMADELAYVSRELVELELYRIKLRNSNPELEAERSMVAQLTEAELTRIKLEENEHVDVEAREMTMGGLTSIEDQLVELSEKVFDKITGYGSDLLEEELGTSLEDEYHELFKEKMQERSLRDTMQDILENPRDARRPHVVGNGTESLEAARSNVREDGPDNPLKLENSYPESEFERNERSINKALERVRQREPRYIQ